MTNTVIVGTSWVTAYLVTDILAKDSASEQQIQIFSPLEIKEFFGSFPYLNEYYGDERLDFRRLEDFKPLEFKADFAHNIYFDHDDTEMLALLLDTIKDQGYTGNLILASDYEVYGYHTAKQVPLDERAECTPESAKGKLKLELEEMCDAFRKGAPFGTIVLRFGVVFGPYMGANVLSDMMQQALLNHDIELWPPASRAFDFLYVTDAVRAIQQAFTVRPDPGGFDIYNIGSGYEVKIANVARDLRHLVNSDSVIKYLPVDGQVEAKGYHNQLDISKASKYLEWNPMTETQKGFLQTCWWMQNTLPAEQTQYGAQNIVKTFPQLADDFGHTKLGNTEMVVSNEAFNAQFREAGSKSRKDERSPEQVQADV
jgi:nucleoside-diphosphate-sugar epimerase